MEESIVKLFRSQLNVQKVDAKSYSPLALAYIGDGVYDLIVRTVIVSRANMQVNKYHKHVSKLVRAQAQADMITKIEDRLTNEEEAVYKRGRNAKSYTSAKNASIIEYRMATGFEALIGYLYLNEEFERIIELVKLGLETIEKSE